MSLSVSCTVCHDLRVPVYVTKPPPAPAPPRPPAVVAYAAAEQSLFSCEAIRFLIIEFQITIQISNVTVDYYALVAWPLPLELKCALQS